MATPGADGAAAAASYFIALFAYASATNDLTEWNAMSSPECSFCAGVRRDIEERASRGRRSIGGAEVTFAKGVEVDPGRWYSAQLHVIIDEATDVDTSGNTVDTHPREELDIDVVMTWDGDSWVIDEIGPSPVPAT